MYCTPEDKKKKRKLVRKWESITEERENLDGPWRLWLPFGSEIEDQLASWYHRGTKRPMQRSKSHQSCQYDRVLDHLIETGKWEWEGLELCLCETMEELGDQWKVVFSIEQLGNTVGWRRGEGAIALSPHTYTRTCQLSYAGGIRK